jgi:hypothetical protein
MLHKSSLLVSLGVGLATVLYQPSTAWAQPGPDLVIAISHTGNFTEGQNGVYTIVVSNIGVTASSGQIDAGFALNPNATFPPQLGTIEFQFVSATGTGWTCFAQYGFPADSIGVTCFSSIAIAPGASAFPITLTVIPDGSPENVSGTVTQMAVVGYPCSSVFVCTNNNSASDPTMIVAAVPTLPEWAMMTLAVLLTLAGVAALRRRTA